MKDELEERESERGVKSGGKEMDGKVERERVDRVGSDRANSAAESLRVEWVGGGDAFSQLGHWLNRERR